MNMRYYNHFRSLTDKIFYRLFIAMQQWTMAVNLFIITILLQQNYEESFSFAYQEKKELEKE